MYAVRLSAEHAAPDCPVEVTLQLPVALDGSANVLFQPLTPLRSGIVSVGALPAYAALCITVMGIVVPY